MKTYQMKMNVPLEALNLIYHHCDIKGRRHLKRTCKALRNYYSNCVFRLHSVSQEFKNLLAQRVVKWKCSTKQGMVVFSYETSVRTIIHNTYSEVMFVALEKDDPLKWTYELWKLFDGRWINISKQPHEEDTSRL